MSIVNLRAALEIALNGMSPAIQTAWENNTFTPTHGTAFQRVHLLPAEPENPVYGGDFKREVGILQVMLHYPLQVGPSTAAARAELLQTTFFRGAAFVYGGVSVIIQRTPEIAPALIEDNWYIVPVRVRYFANIS
jgi:hypothetical protein